MGEKLEFGDFYKFITSVGVGLLLLAFAVPWAFLREGFDLRIPSAELRNLPTDSAAIIHRRWAIEALIFQHLVLISCSLALVGTIFLVLGCCLWWYRQRVRDRAENAATEIAEREALQPMDESQIRVNAGAEIQAPVEQVKTELDRPREVAPESTAVSAYIALESRIGAKLKECFARRFEVLSQQRLGAAIFDFVLRSRDGVEQDVVIELKGRPKYVNTNAVLTGLRQAALGAQAYAAAIQRRPIPLLLLVVSEGSESADELRRRVIQIRSLDSTLNGVRVWVIPESTFFDARCDSLILLFGAALLAS